MESAVRSPWIKSAITTGRGSKRRALGLPRLPKSRQPVGIGRQNPCRGERNFWMQRLKAKNRPERPQVSPETERAERYRRKSPQKRPIWSRPCDSWFGRTGWWRWYGSNWLPPTQSYRTASLPPAWIAVISLWLRAACGRYLGPNVHRARRHEEDAAPSRHRSLSPNESAGRPSVMNSTAATAPSSQAASREPKI